VSLIARRAPGPAPLIEEVGGRRCGCGAPLFRLTTDGHVAWIRCLAGHDASAAPPALSVPNSGTAGNTGTRAPVRAAPGSRNGSRPVSRAMARPSRLLTPTLFPASVCAAPGGGGGRD
jgi:hypothetical protein